MLKKFRCTRNRYYELHDSAGKYDLSARNGIYVHAETADDALDMMAKTFPKDIEGKVNIKSIKNAFTVQENW